MPMFDGQLAGDDGRTGAVPVIEDFEQVTPAFISQRRQSPVINHQHLGLGQLRQCLGVTAITPADGQCRQEARQAHVEGGTPLSARLIGQSTGKEGLADAGRAANQHILVVTDPAAGHQARKQGPVEATRMAEIDILRCRRLFQSGPFQAGSVLPRFALGQFAVNQQTEPFLEGELADVGLLGLAGQSLGHAGQAELMQLVDGWVMEHGYFLSGQW